MFILAFPNFGLLGTGDPPPASGSGGCCPSGPSVIEYGQDPHWGRGIGTRIRMNLDWQLALLLLGYLWALRPPN